MFIEFEITEYSLALEIVNLASPMQQFGSITCTGEKDGITCVLYLRFILPESAIGANQGWAFVSQTWAGASPFLPYSCYSSCVDLLRNEKPVFGQINDINPRLSKIFTRNEKVGEYEDLMKNLNPPIV